MKKVITGSVILSIVLGLSGCGGTKPSKPVLKGPDISPEASREIVEMVPSWYTEPQQKEGFITGKGEGASAGKHVSRMKAITALVSDFRIKMNAWTKGRGGKFAEELGGDYDSSLEQKYELVQNLVWEGAVKNWTEVNSVTVVERTEDAKGKRRNIFRTYIVGQLDRFQADAELLMKIKRDKELLMAFKETNAYEKLEEDLEKYRQRVGK